MEKEIKQRTKRIGVEIIELVDTLPTKTASFVISKQIIRSSTSIGANYRACRAKSGPDFINKLKIVEEEADETLYWLEILEDSNLIKSEKISMLKKEVDEIVSMMVASINTLKNKNGWK